MTISATTQGIRPGVATSTTRPAVPFDGQVIYETDTDTLKVYNGSSWVGVGGNIAMFNETQTSATAGGSSTSGSFAKRTLNTTVTNNISGCSIASSVVTLATAGTYYLRGSTPVYRGDQTQARLRNTTASTTIANGQGSFAAFSNNGFALCPVEAYVTISASTNIELQMRVSTSHASEGLGIATGFDESIYSTLYIERIA